MTFKTLTEIAQQEAGIVTEKIVDNYDFLVNGQDFYDLVDWESRMDIFATWNKIDFRECLSDILKCDTTTWDPDKLCEEVNKLHPRIKMIPYRHKKNHYWIRKKYDYEQ